MIISPGELFFQHDLLGEVIQEGEFFRRGSYFFNVFSLLTEQNSFQNVAKLSFVGQRMRPIVYTMSSSGSYSRELFF